MATTLKIQKVSMVNPSTRAEGYATRVVSNGTKGFTDLSQTAARNTTMHAGEIKLAGDLLVEAASQALKEGCIVDLGPLGKLYPSVSGKWSDTPEGQVKSDLKPKINYRPGEDLAAAISSAKLSWVSAADETKDADEPGADVSGSGSAGGDGGSTGVDNGSAGGSEDLKPIE